MADIERDFPNCYHDDCELQRKEYCEQYELDPKHQALLEKLAKDAENLINIDIDRAHMSYRGDNDELVVARSFEYDVAPDSVLYNDTYQEYLECERHDNHTGASLTYEIITGWSIEPADVQHAYTLKCGNDTISATVSDDTIEEERAITEYDVQQLTDVFNHYRQLAPVDPTYSRVG